MRNPIPALPKGSPGAGTIWGSIVTGGRVIDHLRELKKRGKKAAGEMVTLWGAVRPLRPGKDAKMRTTRCTVRGGGKASPKGFGTIWDHLGQIIRRREGRKGYEAWYEFKTVWGNFNFCFGTFPFRPPVLCVRERR